MRLLPAAVVALLFAPAAARADEPRAVRLPRHAWGLFFAGGAQFLGPAEVGGVGLDVEHARGFGRWQVFGEAIGARLGGEALTPGFGLRLGAGVRYTGPSLQPDHSAGIELYLESGTGVQTIVWDGGGRLVRPDLSFGWGVQLRKLPEDDGDRQWIIRLGLQFFVGQAGDHEVMTRIVCRGGSCPDPIPPQPIDTGFVVQMGASWGR
jgi:hypothetical protein